MTESQKPQVQDGDGAAEKQKPTQLKDETCEGCGLDDHTGDCVKKGSEHPRDDGVCPENCLL